MPTLEQVLEQYPDKVKVVFKNYPLRSHEFAYKAAAAALAAHSLGKFWTYHDRLFQYNGQLSDEKIDKIAVELGLDPVAFKQRQQSAEVQNLLRQDIRDAVEADVRGTPSVFVNGRLLRRHDLSGFQAAIEAEQQRPAARK